MNSAIHEAFRLWAAGQARCKPHPGHCWLQWLQSVDAGCSIMQSHPELKTESAQNKQNPHPNPAHASSSSSSPGPSFSAAPRWQSLLILLLFCGLACLQALACASPCLQTVYVVICGAMLWWSVRGSTSIKTRSKEFEQRSGWMML